MRVLFLTDSLSDLDGVGRYTIRLIAALEELEPKLEVEILLARKHRPTSSQVPTRWKVSVALPPDYFFHMSKPKFWASLALGVAKTFPRASKADLVHAIKDYPHNLLGLVSAKIARVPCVATAHGTYSVQPLLDPRHAKLSRWTYRRLDALISVSRYTAKRLRDELGEDELASEKLSVIPNAVDAAHYRGERSIGVKAWHGVRYTLAIGELKERKGHHVSIGAFAKLAAQRPELHHFVIGKLSDADYHARLVELARSAGVESRLHFLGNVDEDEKIDCLQRAALFVHTPVTSKDGGFEGFGIVYLEAAACGVPCVGTRESGAEDAVLDGANGILCAPNIDDAARAIERILDDRELARRMGEQGRSHAESSSWSDNAKRVLEIYRRLIR